MLGTPTQYHTFVLNDDTGQKTRLNKFDSFWQQQASFQKVGPAKILIGSCTDINVDSGSNLKYWLRLRLLLQPKMQTPAGVHSGTPPPWSSLPCAYLRKYGVSTHSNIMKEI